ncbi:LysR family transcriptional regulator [Roseomonas mucosa]|uniref:LysR family transcriptional regulator n=1 Tax=Roseomonas mucosa TaxID=207340 RepID=UPI0028CF64B9|nr:LysR substrate-binding domain-containing protein [Roseomonas mucosa]MDT8351016.1 LysR substrate-binding domain-containing protein [Roseomonas mucosa]
MFDLDDLRSFIEVAEAGGVSPAAARLGVAKSVVSRRLLRLERQLDTQLLARTTRGSSLTEAGVTLREYAARACAEMELARDLLRPDGEVRGRLRLALPITFGLTHVAPVLAELGRQHPQLQVQASYSDAFVDLVGGGFDAAIRVGHLQDSSLLTRRIAPVQGKVVASPGYVERHGAPRTLAELAGHEVLMQGSETWRLLDGEKVVAVHPRGRFKADSASALAAAALAGLGLAYLPDFVTDSFVASGALVPVLTRHPVPQAGLYVVRPPGTHASRKVQVLIDAMVAAFGDAGSSATLEAAA